MLQSYGRRCGATTAAVASLAVVLLVLATVPATVADCTVGCLNGFSCNTTESECDCGRNYTGTYCQTLWPSVTLQGCALLARGTFDTLTNVYEEATLQSTDVHPGHCSLECFTRMNRFYSSPLPVAIGSEPTYFCICYHSLPILTFYPDASTCNVDCPGFSNRQDVSFSCGSTVNTSISVYRFSTIPPVGPFITTTPSLTTVRWVQAVHVTPGDAVTMNCGVSSPSNPLNYTWAVDGVPLPLVANQATYSFVVTTTTGAGLYQCNVTNLEVERAGQNFSLPISQVVSRSVIVQVPPSVSVSPSNVTTVIRGDDVTLSCTVHGDYPTSIRWMNATTGQTLASTSGLALRTLQLSLPRANYSSNYTCLAENADIVEASQRTASASVTVIVQVPPQAIINEGSSLVVSVPTSDGCLVTCTSPGDPRENTLQWNVTTGSIVLPSGTLITMSRAPGALSLCVGSDLPVPFDPRWTAECVVSNGGIVNPSLRINTATINLLVLGPFQFKPDQASAYVSIDEFSSGQLQVTIDQPALPVSTYYTLQWFHVVDGVRVNVTNTSRTYENGTSVWQLAGARNSDSGVYQAEATSSGHLNIALFSLTVVDLDDCLVPGLVQCHAQSSCAYNTTSQQASCPCNAGYQLTTIQQQPACVDLNECAATHDCSENATCTNTVGSFYCTCNVGYTGNGTHCVDIDECSQRPCSNVSSCTNTAGAFFCQCMAGFSGDGVTCADLDECLLQSASVRDCSENSTCRNTIGSFTCTCLRGFSGNGSECVDVDECRMFTASQLGCDRDNSVCLNTVGSFHCQCKDGYSGNGTLCTDIDECLLPPAVRNCSQNATCLNQPGSYACVCSNGFHGDGAICDDTDECSVLLPVQRNCSNNSVCSNTHGSFTCQCNIGYGGDGAICSDLDECSLAMDNCSALATCSNTQGSYTCNCSAGYNGTGFTCLDLNECSLDIDNCHANAVCSNVNGSFACRCLAGFSGDGVLCMDTDECLISPCSSDALCSNSRGGFSCQCLPGFSGNGAACEDLNECQMSVAPCAANGTCTNTPGSFSCRCRDGFTGDALLQCADLDECAVGGPGVSTCTAEHSTYCVNDVGSFHCECLQGYQPFNSTLCLDQDECGLRLDNCAQNTTCTNTAGAFNCTCNVGFTGNGTRCSDVNECDLVPSLRNCDNHSVCTNSIGSFSCQCAIGFAGNGTKCRDSDECTQLSATARNCSQNSTCANIIGSFICTCLSGFVGDGSVCTDENECLLPAQSRNCSNDSACTNTIGSFLCHCRDGFTGDGANCSDIDECLTTASLCTGERQCVNTHGSFMCVCRSGFTGNDTVCSDIDECASGVHDCTQNATCVNSIGGHSCSCATGFAGNATVLCADVNECNASSAGHNTSSEQTPSSSPCGNYSTCTNTLGSFSCPCSAGFHRLSSAAGPTDACVDTDECLSAANACVSVSNATCKNTVGSFRCDCLSGYARPSNGSAVSNASLLLSDCLDVNECASSGSSPCQPFTTCNNTLGSYECHCISGYVLVTALDACVNRDECLDGSHDCAANARCTDANGTYGCECLSGFTGTGTVCSDIDECSAVTIPCVGCSDYTTACGQNSMCFNTVGNFSCQCLSGFNGTDRMCTDIDECVVGNVCHVNATCSNVAGSFVCTCVSGYTGNGTSCQDIDECTLGLLSCGVRESCYNTLGGAYCACAPGYGGELANTALLSFSTALPICPSRFHTIASGEIARH
eukprot:scpid11083/ scgid1619/ Fibrillin-2